MGICWNSPSLWQQLNICIGCLHFSLRIWLNSNLGCFSKSEPFSCVNNCKLVPFSVSIFTVFLLSFIRICLFSIVDVWVFFSNWLQVLIESKQMRKEADDSGPLTELEHWKCMSAKFNFIIEQIKGPNCKAVINILSVGHSKLLRVIIFFLMLFFYYSRQTCDNYFVSLHLREISWGELREENLDMVLVCLIF